MDVQLLPDGDQNAVADLCHHVHTDFDACDHEQVDDDGEEDQPEEAAKVSGRNVIIYGGFHDQRIQEVHHDAEAHDKQDADDLFFIGKKVGEQARKRCGLSGCYRILILFIGIKSHNSLLMPWKNSARPRTGPARFHNTVRAGRAGFHVSPAPGWFRFPAR